MPLLPSLAHTYCTKAQRVGSKRRVLSVCRCCSLRAGILRCSISRARRRSFDGGTPRSCRGGPVGVICAVRNAAASNKRRAGWTLSAITCGAVKVEKVWPPSSGRNGRRRKKKRASGAHVGAEGTAKCFRNNEPLQRPQHGPTQHARRRKHTHSRTKRRGGRRSYEMVRLPRTSQGKGQCTPPLERKQ